MANKSHALANGWTLIAHKLYKVYANENSYILIDNTNDVMMQFTVTDQEFEVTASSWNLNFKIIPAFKTVKVLNIPEEE
ncbi:TPA: hypothetical protein G9C53_004993 [Salmonella enterica subsp. enterica serovar Typhimurium var. 5-]|uniref:Uncharacterized protein n=1 Tax=Salmonella enterica subsp. enterica serovar Typhimurium var. 5- TaxID=1620419 RepID=A0A740PVA3_SALTM|nr:hypothetical protein [Salmonella enterica subsp. enterica serovar Typhimurium var. 5-]